MSRPAPARRPLRLHLLGLGVIGCTLLVASCGNTSAIFSDKPPGAGAEAGAKAGGGSGQMASGGVATKGGSHSGGTASSTGGAVGTAGASAGTAGGFGAAAGGGALSAGGGGTASAGASTGEAGAGGADAPLGVDCRDTHCVAGDVCVSCSSPSGADWLCVPHPVTQPEAYAKATARCEPAPYGYSECDGPEDCPPDQYCVAQDGPDGRQRCRSAPAPGFCCFTCDAAVNCTLCRDNGDCPDGESCSVVFENLKGCSKR